MTGHDYLSPTPVTAADKKPDFKTDSFFDGMTHTKELKILGGHVHALDSINMTYTPENNAKQITLNFKGTPEAAAEGASIMGGCLILTTGEQPALSRQATGANEEVVSMTYKNTPLEAILKGLKTSELITPTQYDAANTQARALSNIKAASATMQEPQASIFALNTGKPQP